MEIEFTDYEMIEFLNSGMTISEFAAKLLTSNSQIGMETTLSCARTFSFEKPEPKAKAKKRSTK